MGRYLLSRLAQAVLVLIGVSLGSFALIHLTPGNPVRLMLGVRANPVGVAALTKQLGLTKPLPEQYLNFIENAVKLNFGKSIVEDVSVGSLMGPRAVATGFLALYSSLIGVIIAVPLGIISAVRRNRPADHVVRVVTMVAFGMPAFWLGIVLVVLLSITVHVFPSSGYGTGFFGHLYSLTLPALTLGLGLAPMLVRTLRISLIEALSSDYVEAARARGFSRRRVLLRHALRTSILSTVTVLGVNIGYLLGGVVVIENVFDLPGLGQMLVLGVIARDFPVIEALALVFAVFVVVVNLLTDLLYSVIDPRIRL